MLIRVDENISWRIVDALTALRLPDGVHLETAHHREEAGILDVDWISDFALRGGRLFISGDASMRAVHLERAALEASGLVAVFPSSKGYFDGLRKWGQAAYLTIWFPSILRLANEAEQGCHFQLPPSLSSDFEAIKRLKSLVTIEAEREEKARARDAIRDQNK
jgi:PIN like domain